MGGKNGDFMFKSMSFKVFLLASSFAVSLQAMDGPGKGSAVRKELPGFESEQNAAKKAKIDAADNPYELDIHDTILLGIHNIDVVAMGALLLSDTCKLLSPDQKSKLYELASHNAAIIREISQQGSLLTAHATDMQVRQRFSHQEDLVAIKKIEGQLNVFRYLKTLRFPQALFSAKPYHNGPRISLDHALEALIMAEEEHISSCCFHLSLFNIARALVNKKIEGVQIELVTNQTQGMNPSLHALKHMASNGVLLFSTRNSTWEMNHHKFFVFKRNVLDKPLVWMGSYNPTGTSNDNAWDDVVILDDNEIIQSYLHRFAEIKSASKAITYQELQSTPSNPCDLVLKYNNVPRELWK